MRTGSPVPTIVALAIGVVLTLPTAAGASRQAPPSQLKPPTTTPPAAAGNVSLDRIRRQLRETPAAPRPATQAGLKLDYYIQVVGEPPRIDFFKDFNIGRASAVQYGGMTHAEFLRVTAPFWRKW